MAQTFHLRGASGQVYVFEEADLTPNWKPVPGNYVFLNAVGFPVYVGETSNLASRQPGPTHPQWHEAQRHGAVAVAAHANVGGGAARRAEERDLILKHHPPANQRIPHSNLENIVADHHNAKRRRLVNALLSARQRGARPGAR